MPWSLSSSTLKRHPHSFSVMIARFSHSRLRKNPYLRRWNLKKFCQSLKKTLHSKVRPRCQTNQCAKHSRVKVFQSGYKMLLREICKLKVFQINKWALINHQTHSKTSANLLRHNLSRVIKILTRFRRKFQIKCNNSSLKILSEIPKEYPLLKEYNLKFMIKVCRKRALSPRVRWPSKGNSIKIHWIPTLVPCQFHPKQHKIRF